jgi:hypothetical protein
MTLYKFRSLRNFIQRKFQTQNGFTREFFQPLLEKIIPLLHHPFQRIGKTKPRPKQSKIKHSCTSSFIMRAADY